MKNNNTSLKWLHQQTNIFLDEKIEDINNPIRGIYGIFIKYQTDKNLRCVYVGRSNSIYGRMFDANKGHIAMMKKNKHFIPELNPANHTENIKISIEILEEVSLKYDDYHKDMQRLESAENYHINKYQSIDECLNQVPEGTNINEEKWESMKKEDFFQ